MVALSLPTLVGSRSEHMILMLPIWAEDALCFLVIVRVSAPWRARRSSDRATSIALSKAPPALLPRSAKWAVTSSTYASAALFGQVMNTPISPGLPPG